MTHVQMDNGDLHFIFKKYEDKTPLIYKLDNGGELEFIDDEFVGLVLPNFEQQLNRGHINDIKLENIHLENDDVVFNIVVNGQNIAGKVNLSSLDRKI